VASQARGARFISDHWRPGVAGALRMGFVHGAFCLGCCWLLMGLLFFGGVMNLLGSPVSRSSCCRRRCSPSGRRIMSAAMIGIACVVLLSWRGP
jgi:predicted metal-binding membrane protein